MIVAVPANTLLVRVHSVRFGPAEFNPNSCPTAEAGGRFDSLGGEYSYLYAGEDDDVAIAEALLRQVPFPSDGPRQLPRRVLENLVLSRLRTTRELQVVSLRGADLGQINQDVWLTKCEAADYVETRQWAAAIRTWAPDASGFVWRSRRDEDHLAYVLFGDRTPRECLALEGDLLPIDGGPGLVLVRRSLLRQNVVVAR